MFAFGAECGIIEKDGRLRDNKGRFASSGASGGGESVGSDNGGETGNNMTEAAGTAGGFSATGANPDLPGFSEKALNNHFGSGGRSDHSKDYKGWTKEQYAERALELVRSPVGGDILGYKAADGAIVRYDKAENDFVKGFGTGIATMYKLKGGEQRFSRIMQREGGSQSN